MAEVAQSPDVIALARDLGVDIDSSVKFDSKTPLLKVAQQLNGEDVSFGAEDAEFGSLFSKLFKHSGLKKISEKQLSKQAGKPVHITNVHVNVKESVKGLAKGIGTAAAVASFVVPGAGPLIGGSALAAMHAADKLLGDPNIKGAAKLVSNTKALAALGNVPARRGAAVLGAVAQIRQAKAAPPGRAVIPAYRPPVVATAAAARPLPPSPPPVVNTAAYVQAVPRTQVKALAVNAVAVAKKKTFWQKVKDLFS